MFTLMTWLMGAREIEQRLGVSRQRVQQLISRADWPRPAIEFAMGKAWWTADVEAWIADHRPSITPKDRVDKPPTPPAWPRPQAD